MESEFSKLFDEYEQSETSFCYTILDIDHFKKFNDNYGHDVGDVVLSDVARVVSGAVSRQDIVARYGGEEFVILSPDTELHEAGQLLERVRAAVEANAVRNDSGELKVTISLGVAQFGAENSAALSKRADTALYAAKEAGRNRAYFHDGLHTNPISLGGSSSTNDGRSDQLTELPSQAAFTDELGRRIAESTRTQAEVSLIVLEIDQLAAITEDHGNQTADLVRRGVAAFLTDIMRDMDLVARNGENSFCMLLPACSLDDATSAAERVRIAAGKTPFQIDNIELELTLSAGVTTAAPGEPSDSLMERRSKGARHGTAIRRRSHMCRAAARRCRGR
jgi:diguanylate cyclase (GGDEF)-like protein